MTRLLLAVVLATTACRCDSPKLLNGDPRCGRPCYGGDPKNAGVGRCGFGSWTCGGDGGPECLGWIAPAPETCDGADEDCDGVADDGLDPRPCYDGPPGTEGVGPCRAGHRVCHDGAWTSACIGEVVPTAEVCDGVDNDCDGSVDDLALAYCYDGPPGTLCAACACHPGFEACQFSTSAGWTTSCVGEQLPRPETCNGRDDDCNGIVDDGFYARVQVAAIFCTGFSMTNDGPKFAAGLAAWLNKYPTAELAVIDAFDTNVDNGGQAQPARLLTDFASASNAIRTMSLMKYSPPGAGDVPIYDAVVTAIDPTVAYNFALSWDPSAVRAVVVACDEEAQGLFFPQATEFYVDRAAIAFDAPILVFANQTYGWGFAAKFVPEGGAVDAAGLPNLTSAQVALEVERIVQAQVCGP